MAAQMQAPAATATKCFMPDGTTYTPDANGFVASVANNHIIYMMLSGYQLSNPAGAARSNLTATTDPLVTSDSASDYAAGSTWVNVTSGRVWSCLSAAVGVAVWALSSQCALNFRNMLDGGDFTVNPWQRNIPGLASGGVISAAIAATATYFADRFFAKGGASSAILMAQVADATLAGFNQCLKWSRQVGNADVAVLNFGQVVESADSIRAQGQQVVFSFWAKAGANFSAAASTIGVQVISGTGTNQTAANMVAVAWTGQTNVVNATQALTSSWVRYQFTGTVPAGCTQLGVLLFFTPVGTAGADDSVSLQGLQLELGAVASPLERRDVQVELEICQRYAFVVPEPASGVLVAAGSVSATNTEIWSLGLPVQMRAAPSTTVTVGSFKSNSSTGGIVAASGLTGNATHTVNSVGLTASGTGTAGQAALLQGGGGTGSVVVSADL